MSVFSLEFIGIQTRIIKPNDNIISVLNESITGSENGKDITIKSSDIIVISSKILSMQQNLIVDLESVVPSDKADKLAKLSDLPSNFVQVVIDEADEIIGTTKGALLTISNGIVQANAGIDKSNAGKNKAILLTKDNDTLAKNIKSDIEQLFNVKDVGVLIIDSTTRPLRLGTSAFALGTAGFPAITDDRGLTDLFGYEMKITFKNIADNLASASNLIMGESSEAIPFVIVRGLNKLSQQFKWSWKEDADQNLKIAVDKCMYFGNLKYKAL